jgi:vancomycin resistance protein YoaR
VLPPEPLPTRFARPDTAGMRAVRRFANRPRWSQILQVVLTIVLVVMVAAVGERIAYDGKVLPGVAVPGAAIAGQNTANARQVLDELAKTMEHEAVVAKHGTTTVSISPQQVGFKINTTATLNNARRAGRGRNPLSVLSGVLLRRVRDDNIPLVYSYSESQMTSVLDQWSDAVADGLENGGLKFVGTTVVEMAPRSGIGLQRGKAERLLLRALLDPKHTTFDLPVGHATPAVGAAAVHEAAVRARELLQGNYTVHTGGHDFLITPTELASAMGTHAVGSRLVLDVDSAKLATALAPKLAPLQTVAKDATWNVNGENATVVPSVPAQTVNLTDVGTAIIKGEHSIQAAVTTQEPAHDTAWANKLHITHLVSTFTTNYSPGQPRVTNIQTAARTINGTVVLPGATFSLNGTLGQRTPEKGYVMAPAIAADLTEPDTYGGGVSQVSTTLFNATFFGGYRDTEHSPHALFIPRYPMGREATLNFPSIDNQFTNDSPNGILIEAYAGYSSITISYYSTSDGRSVKAVGPTILQTIPPTTEYDDTPFLPVGQTKVELYGETGYVVQVLRVISRPGQADVTTRYVTNYSMRPTRVWKGAATVAPTTTAPGAPPTTTTTTPQK